MPIRVHWSFSLLVLLVAFSYRGAPYSVIATTALWIAVLFGSVTVHELSHSLVAMRLGLKVHDIILLPIGGVSEIEGIESTAETEGKVAIAGPLASVLLGAVLLGVAAATGAALWPPSFSSGSWLTRVGWLNLALAAFNLLPALPMDGGRVFRSLLARGGDVVRATKIAAVVAGVFGAAMIGYGVVRDFFLVLIGAFVLFGASAEWQAARVRAATAGLTVGQLMHGDATAAPETVMASEVASWLVHFPGRAVPVVDGTGRYVGLADIEDLAGAPFGYHVGQVCDRRSPSLAPETEVYPAAVEVFQNARRTQLAVVSAGRPVGVVYLPAVTAAVSRVRSLTRS